MVRTGLILSFLIVVSLLLPIGYREGVTAPVPVHLMPKGSPFFPNRVGTKWLYASEDGEYIWELVRLKDQEGAKFITVDVIKDRKEKTSQRFAVRKEGVFLEFGTPFFVGEGQFDGKSWCVLPLRFPAGASWDARAICEGGGILTGKMRVAAVEEVKVPAGTFTAARIEWHWAVSNQPFAKPKEPGPTYWYAPGVGLIQIGDPPVVRLKAFAPVMD